MSLVNSSATILDGLNLSRIVQDQIQADISEKLALNYRMPSLDVILVGDNPASQTYVRNKIKACTKCQINGNVHNFPKEASLKDIKAKIIELNENPDCDGILIQLPLPAHLPSQEILSLVDPNKDVDGLHPYNLGLLLSGDSYLQPCTPYGIMTLLNFYNIDLSGKSACVIGRSNLVGKPVSLLLAQKNATVTLCHSKTADLPDIAKASDILIAAIGKPNFVDKNFIKKGACVVDVGINYINDASGKSVITGDVVFEDALANAKYITPVPGGVGPMTVSMLLKNTYKAYIKKLIQQ